MRTYKEDSITRAIDKVILQFMYLRVPVRVGLIVAGLAAFITVLAWQDNVDSRYHCDNGGLAVVVSEGDTLWGIAEKYCTGSTVTAVDDLHKVYGSTLHRGEIIHLMSKD
jgi:hypothetical protein